MKRHGEQKESRHKAARYVSRLWSGEMTVQQAEKMGDSSVGGQREFLAMTHLLADMEGLENSPAIQDVIAQVDRAAPKAGFWRGASYAWAASLLLGCVVILYLWTGIQTGTDSEQLQRYVTRVGEQKEVLLPDGSLVSMNTATEIMVNYQGSDRKVHFVRGEAYFVVEDNPERPFSVELGARTVSVLGTEFNVRKLSDSFAVGVTKGSVALHKSAERVGLQSSLPKSAYGERTIVDAAAQYRLTAGGVIEFDAGKNDLVAYRIEDIDSRYGWRSGVVSFSGDPLYRVVQDLNRYSAKKILIVDPVVMNLEIYAGLKVNNIAAALKNLEMAYPIEVSHDFDQILIESKK